MKATARERLQRHRAAQAEAKQATTTARANTKAIALIDFVVASHRNPRRPYLAGWVHELVCKRLEEFSNAVARGESPRLMLFLPPRHGKSYISSERFPVWHLGRFPQHKIVVASHSQSLSNGFSRRARELTVEELVAEHFPDLKISDERRAVSEWETTEGGGYKAVGVGGGLTGSGADILIIDDVVKDAKQADSDTHREGAWDWYSSTASTRLMPGGGVLVILTRWHEEDLAGKLLEQAENDPDADQWEVIRFPAIAEADEWLLDDGDVIHDATGAIDFDRAKARLLRRKGEALHNERFNVPALNKKARSMIARHWLALYQQRPSSQEGNLFKRDWWQEFTYKPTAKFDKLIQSWDFTFDDGDNSDFVVGQVWGARGEEFFLLDQVRGQMDAPAAIAAIKALSRKWPKARAKLVEKKANGAAIMKLLKGTISGFIPVEPMGSKVQRASAIAPDVQSGNVYLPDDAPWVSDFIEEHAAFPKGPNDDQVDATSQALIYLTGYSSARDKLNALIGRGKKTS